MESARHWRVVSLPGGPSLRTVCAVPGTRTLWAAGYDGALIRSDDAGEHWTDASCGVERAFSSIHFADTDHGCAVGWRIVARTSDGGRSWTLAESPYRLESVRFRAPAIGITVGAGGVVVRTEDGGRTWRRVRSGTRARLKAVWPLGSEEFLAVGDHGAVLRRGARRAVVAPGSLDAVCFVGAAHGWLAGSDGRVLYTSDGGGTWARGITGTQRLGFSALAFLDTHHGWALGNGLGSTYSPIIRTENGGQTWKREFSGTTNPVRAATVVGHRVCAVGRFGTVLLREAT